MARSSLHVPTPVPPGGRIVRLDDPGSRDESNRPHCQMDWREPSDTSDARAETAHLPAIRPSRLYREPGLGASLKTAAGFFKATLWNVAGSGPASPSARR